MTEAVGKVCRGCGGCLPLSSFSPQRRGLFGVRAKCKSCLAKLARGYRVAHPDVARESTRRWHAANPDYRSTWNDANRERIAEVGKVWRSANPDKVRAKNRVRRAILQSLPHEAYSFSDIVARDLDGEIVHCGICHSELSPYDSVHVDHLIPLAVDPASLLGAGILRHPGDVLANVALTHESCNCSKGDRLLPEHVEMYLRNVDQGLRASFVAPAERWSGCY